MYYSVDYQRECLIWKAKNKKELEDCLTLFHNMEKYNDKAKTFKDTDFFDVQRVTKEEAESADDISDAREYIDNIKKEFSLKKISDKKLVQMSFEGKLGNATVGE